jgi:hypothetical protein
MKTFRPNRRYLCAKAPDLPVHLLEFERQPLQFHTFLGAFLCHFAPTMFWLACCAKTCCCSAAAEICLFSGIAEGFAEPSAMVLTSDDQERVL